MSKLKCYNCREMGHFARNCPKPRENANIARESEQNQNYGKLMDFGDSSVCEECTMICTDAYSDEEYKNTIVYGDQGVSTKNYDEETYRDLLKSDSDDDSIVKYNVALCVKDSVSLEKKQRRLNRNTPSETRLTEKSILYHALQATTTKTSCGKRGPWGCQRTRRRYLHDKHSRADTNRGSQQAVPICTSGTRKSYDSVPHEQEFRTSARGRRVPIHGR